MRPSSTGPARPERLESLKLALAEREYTTVGDLAADLGVSERTVYRDLALLRELGVPVSGVSGRGGGVYLERGWSLGRVHLNETEAMGLLLSLAIAQRTGSPLLLDDIRSIERKVVQAFAPSQATRIRSLRSRVLIGPAAAPTTRRSDRAASSAVTRPLLEGFIDRRVVAIRYVDRADSTTEREIQPHHLYYRTPLWYVLAWDGLRDQARSFRIDRMTRAAVGAARFAVRPTAEFADVALLDARPL